MAMQNSATVLKSDMRPSKSVLVSTHPQNQEVGAELFPTCLDLSHAPTLAHLGKSLAWRAGKSGTRSRIIIGCVLFALTRPLACHNIGGAGIGFKPANRSETRDFPR